MQEEQIDPLQAHPFQAFLEAGDQVALDFVRRRRAEPVLGRDPNGVGEPALEGVADRVYHPPMPLAHVVLEVSGED